MYVFTFKIYQMTLLGKRQGTRLLREETMMREDREWIHLASDRDRWWALFNTTMGILVLKKRGISQDERNLA
jgi:hypothetical protein